jgi:hypothetical protein
MKSLTTIHPPFRFPWHGPVLLVGDSYAGVAITERVGKVNPSIPLANRTRPHRLGSELQPDAQGFLTDTRKGIAEDMAQDLSDGEEQIFTAT